MTNERCTKQQSLSTLIALALGDNGVYNSNGLGSRLILVSCRQVAHRNENFKMCILANNIVPIDL